MKSLVVFVKNPELGKVKTRLAQSIGEEAALKVYRFLLNYTKQVADETDCDEVLVYHSLSVNPTDNWKGEKVKNKLQVSGDLGMKMNEAIQSVGLSDEGPIVLIGSDCLEITSDIIESAFNSLRDHDIVIGPASDGGYYLIGMNQPESFVFKNKPWSTDDLFNVTKKEIEKNNKKLFVLEELSDIDVEADLSNKLNWKEL